MKDKLTTAIEFLELAFEMAFNNEFFEGKTHLASFRTQVDKVIDEMQRNELERLRSMVRQQAAPGDDNGDANMEGSSSNV